MVAGFGLIELIILLVFGGGGIGGLPLAMPPLPEDERLYHVAPAEVMFYTTWMGLAEPDGQSPNITEQMLARPEIRNLLTKIEDSFFQFNQQRVDQRGRDAEAQTNQTLSRLTADLLTHHTALYMTTFEVEPTLLTGGMVSRLGADLANERMEQLQGILAANFDEEDWSRAEREGRAVIELFLSNGQRLELTTAGEFLCVAIGEERVEEIVTRIDGATPPWLTEVRDSIEVTRLSTLSYADGESIFGRLREAFGREPAWDVFANLGLADFQGFYSGTGLDERGARAFLQMQLNKEPEGIWQLLSGAPLNADSFATIPAETPAAFTMSLNPETLLEVYTELLKSLDPFSADMVDDAMGMGSETLGVDIREQVLGAFGDRFTVYAAPYDGGFITGWLAVLEVKNPMVLVQVEQRLTTLIRQLSKGDERAPRLESRKIAGREMFYFSNLQDFVPFTPAWCMTGKELVVGISPQAVISHVRGLASTKHLADNERLAALLQEQTGSTPIVASYVDHGELVRFAYPWMQAMLQLGIAELRREAGIDFDVPDLPSVAALSEGVEPALVVVRRNAAGVSIETRQTLPTADIGATMPGAAALFMPQVFAAQAAAKRMQSVNNLKYIGLAMHNYADVKGGFFPPPYTVDEQGKPLLSWRVMILPYIEQQALYDEFHLDEPWDSEHNIKLIEKMPDVYRQPDADPTTTQTVYQGVALKGAVLGPPAKEDMADVRRGRGVSFGKITDGTSTTIMVVETNLENAVTWTAPDDFGVGMATLERLTGDDPDGFYAAFGDGSVQFVPLTIDLDVLRLLFIMNDGEVIDPDWRR